MGAEPDHHPGPPPELTVVDDVAGAFAALVADRRPATVALSGGGTARRCYERLRDADVPWPGTTVLWGDERWVAVDHPDSNEGMARRVLLDHVPVAAVHSMREAGRTLEAAADAYDERLRRLGPLGLVHLGLGEDAHTASLFPGSPALAEAERLVVAAGDDAHPWPRLTLTFPAIAASRVVVVTVEGAAKREPLARVRRGDDVPAARVRATEVVWLVDPVAAGAG